MFVVNNHVKTEVELTSVLWQADKIYKTGFYTII